MFSGGQTAISEAMTSIPFNLSYQCDKNQADFAHIGNPSLSFLLPSG